MPTYEYECKDCGHRFDQFQSITADALTECPECNGSVQRLISAGAGFLFKGNGFHSTDYRSDSYKQGASKDSGSACQGCPKGDSCPSSGN